MDILAEADRLESAGRRIIHLEVGQPDFATPECVKEAAVQALRDGKTGYTASDGIPPLREAIAEYYERHYGLNIAPERIIVTQGTSPALMCLLAALCENGDTVLTPGPTYACYDSGIRFAGASSIRVPCRAEAGFQLTAEEARPHIRPDTRVILFNSPSNPGGTLIGREEMRRLAGLGPMLLSDEIYHGLTYGEKATSALEVTDNCCVADGFSKRYAMTGWRLGWVVVPEYLRQTMVRLQQNFFLCAGSFAQWAGIAALKYAWPDVERMAAEYDRRRKVLLAGLKRLGFGIRSEPLGAFYILADARHVSGDSLSLARDILHTAGVGVAPGVDFGPEAEGYLRFSYANSVENIEEALDRLKTYLERRD